MQVEKMNGASRSESISTYSPEPINTNIDSQQNTTINILQPITTQRSTMQKSRIYAGVIAGITFNEVKNQGFKKPGLM